MTPERELRERLKEFLDSGFVALCVPEEEVLDELEKLLATAPAPTPAPPTPVCDAPNSQGNYRCNKEPGHPGDHVHYYKNPEGERDFYYWPTEPQVEEGVGK